MHAYIHTCVYAGQIKAANKPQQHLQYYQVLKLVAVWYFASLFSSAKDRMCSVQMAGHESEEIRDFRNEK